MKMIKLPILMIASALTFFSCNAKGKSGDADSKDSVYVTTATGLKYMITQQGTGNKPNKGDRVSVHYTGKFTDGKVFDSSVGRGQPITFELGVGQVIRGWDEGIALLSKGSKALFVIPPDLAYGAQQNGPIPANSTLLFEVELVDIQPAIKVIPYDVTGKEIKQTASGLKYIIVQKGTGDKAVAGKNVKVHYSGYLEDGTMFDSSVKRGEPLDFPLGGGRVIKGWDEGIALMQVGDKFRLLIPSNLAYGDNGYPPVIPGKATLTFDVELVSVAK